MKVFKRVLLIVGCILLAILLFAAGFLGYLTIVEYYPKEVEIIEVAAGADTTATFDGTSFTVLSWNIGYCGLGKESDFFMDGGKMSLAPSKETVEKNYAGIVDALRAADADFTFLQETDVSSKRSYYVTEAENFRSDLKQSSAFAYNYQVDYVPYPLPTLGKVQSGLLTFGKYNLNDEAQRVPLPCPFSWPLRIANLKRCLLVCRVPIAHSDKELVLVNLHLEAYDDGEGKIQQTQKLLSVLQGEYEKGNYVVAGGDFNQIFPDSKSTFPNTHTDLWTPGELKQSDMENFTLVYDGTRPTCRLLNQPYDKTDTQNTQYYVIDGFLISPNLTVDSVRTLDEQDFAFSDHNPVLLTVTLA